MSTIHIADSLLLHAPRQLTWVTERLPDLGPQDLLLRTRAGAISIGTELPIYLGTSRSLHQPTYPLMTGYESIAEVVACGSAVQGVTVGERVVAFYGHRTGAVVAERRVVLIPPDISDQLAVLLILACDTAKGIGKTALHPWSRVAITGAGAIGLLTLFNLHARGQRNVIVIDPVAERRALAVSLGAQATFDPSDPQLYEESCQVAFECSSRNSAFQLLQTMLEPAGQLCVLADGNLEPMLLTPAFHAKELTVVGSSDGLDYRQYAAWFWTIVRSQRYPLTGLFEQTVEASALPATFAALATSAMRPVKVFVEYKEG